MNIRPITSRLSIFLIFTSSSALALECPSAPTNASEDTKVNVKAAVGKLGPVKAAELATEVARTTHDLLAKLPNADRVYLEKMMFSAYCTLLRDNKSMSDEEKGKLLRQYKDDVQKTISKEIKTNSSKTTTINSKKYADLEEIAHRNVIDGIHRDSDVTMKLPMIKEYPGLTIEEVEYRGLKKAVFLRIFFFKANQDILFDALKKAGREGVKGITKPNLERLKGEYQDILRARLKWLKTEVIPKLNQHALQTEQQQQQQACSPISIAIPKDFWVLPDFSIEVSVCDLPTLEAEIDIIQYEL